MHTLHVECPSGIAGDMLLAALIDVGAPVESVRDGLRSLNLAESWSLEVKPTQRRGVAALRAEVYVEGVPADAAGTGYLQEDRHTHGGHRSYRDIRKLLASSSLPQSVRARAEKVFRELALAEGAVHGVNPDDVVFHEVGSTDAVIDVVGCCLALEALNVAVLTVSPLNVGHGFVDAAHGRMPIPAPATARLLEGLHVYQNDVKGELVTPTGAALVRALCTECGPMSCRKIERTGCGAGRMELPAPNVVRVWLSHAAEVQVPWARDEVIELEANLDDVSPEIFSYLFERLYEAGAKDVWCIPATMKKNRPGHILHVMGDPVDEAALVRLVFAETTTLGMRVERRERRVLERAWVEVAIDGEPVRVKIGSSQGRTYNASPEYEDCVRVARRLGRPLKDVLSAAKSQAMQKAGD